VGDYELQEEIARGGMGIVYRARQISLSRTVAVKMLRTGQFASPEEVERFLVEAEAAANLQHPNIVAIHEVGDHEGEPYFSMDYVKGKSLGALGEECKSRDTAWFRRAAKYLQVVGEAIHYAHQQGTLHRDLKPSNVLIDAFDQPRVTDFGLAKRLESESDLTVSGQLLGTPHFMPPEQASAKSARIGPHSDVYSLGAILYFLLSGEPPFTGETVHETVQRVLESEPVRPRKRNPAVPLDLETICLKCLEKAPQRRYASAKELADDLGRFLRDEPIQACPVGIFERSWRKCRRNPVPAALGLAVVLLLGVVVIVVAGRPKAVIPQVPTSRPGGQASRPSYLYDDPVPTVFAVHGDLASEPVSFGLGQVVAVDPFTSHLWCPMMRSNAVVVRDGRTGAVVTNLVLKDCPGAAAFDPMHRLVWVTAQCGVGAGKGYASSDLCWVISATNFVIIQEIPCGGVNGQPELVNPTTGRFYHSVGLHGAKSHAAGLLENSQRIDLENFLPMQMPFGPLVGLDAEANLLYAQGPTNAIQILDGATDPEQVLATCVLQFASGTCSRIVGPLAGRMYAGGAASNQILALEPRTGKVLDTISLEGGASPVTAIAGLATDPARGRLFAIAWTKDGSSLLWVLEAGKQKTLPLAGQAYGPVVNPALDLVYFWRL
jgi:tRNA A-37 threonylcarbamoyl transferase component Bud32